MNIKGGINRDLVTLVTNSDAVSKIAATILILLKKQIIIKRDKMLIAPKIHDIYFIVFAS
jgi:hypothetical protein